MSIYLLQTLFSGRATAFCITRTPSLRARQAEQRLAAEIAHRLVDYYTPTAVGSHWEYASRQTENTFSSARYPSHYPPDNDSLIYSLISIFNTYLHLSNPFYNTIYTSMNIDKSVAHTEESLKEINYAVGEFREQRYLYSIIEGRISAAELHLLETEIDHYIAKEEAECIRLELFAEEFNNNYASNYADLPKRIDYVFGHCIRSTLYDLKKIYLQLCPRKQRRRRSDGSTLHKSVFEHSLASQLMPYIPDLFGLESFPPDKQRLLGKLGVFHCLAKRIFSIAWDLIREENRIILNNTEVEAIYHQHVERIRKDLEGLSPMLRQSEDALQNPLYESSQKDPEHFIATNFHKHNLETFRQFVAIKKCQEDRSRSNPFTSSELEMLSDEKQAARLLTVIYHFDTLSIACRSKKDCEHPVMASEVLIQLMLWSGINDPSCIAPFAAMFARIYGKEGHYLLPTQHSLRSQWNQLLRQGRLVPSPDFARQLDELIEHSH